MRDEEMVAIRRNDEMDEREKNQTIQAKRAKSMEEVLEDVVVLIETHFFNEFFVTKSSMFLKKVIANRSPIDIKLFKKTWRTLNCSPKTTKVIREIRENLLCVGKRKELITKMRAETMCWCRNEGMHLNSKHIISCCGKVSNEINSRHDIIVNILLNNVLIQRGLITHEQRWEDRKMVRTGSDEITVGTEHWVSDDWREKGRVAGAKLKPDLVWLRRDSGDVWRKVVVDVKSHPLKTRTELSKRKMTSTANGRRWRRGRRRSGRR